jgi:hypothetical protein
MAASRWMGRGDKLGADGAAVEAMRVVLASVPMDGIVVIGEGEKDNAPMLFNGERIGDGTPPLTDIAVDPIDGTTLTALGRGGALAVIAVSERGTMFDPGPCVYMEKLAVGPGPRAPATSAAPDREPARPVRRPGAPGARPDRGHPRPAPARRAHRRGAHHRGPHPPHHRRRRGRGHRHRLARAGTDILFGIGGTPEGVLAAAALKCMGGEIQGPALPPQRGGAVRRRRRRLRARRRALDRRPGAGGQLLLRRHRHHRRRAPPGRALPRVRRHHPVAGHALEVGHPAQDRRQPRVGQAVRVQLGLLRLSCSPRPHCGNRAVGRHDL